MAGPDFLESRLDALRAAGNYRELPGTRVGADFWSNDYLGLARRLESLSRPAFHTAPGSRLISGDHGGISALESDIAAFHGFPAALLFGSGYTANLGLLSCIARRTDTIVYDELIHASLRDGIRLSGAAARRCRHNSVSQARRLLDAARDGEGQSFFVTESRFSMDGDQAPLTELAQACDQAGAHLIVDEAHAIGIDGPKGAGCVADQQLQDRIFASVVTYGKAPGFHGAAVVGSRSLRDYLINFSRPFIFTTAPRPAQLAGLAEVYRLLDLEQSTLRQQLQHVIDHYCTRIGSELGSSIPVMDGPIQIMHLPGNDRVMALEKQLLERGLLVKGIRSPSVPRGTERLRICLHAYNTEAEIDQLTTALRGGMEMHSV
ncbi:aminotransferase class I/II-fold pyridoxal phosphate-dependent enzyme [Neolewinella litorea]|uniref:aminotransferase class I/II-fold pyridoxal phosphate-dependent enzyme n=1 Tax=Neolewinella litorea TaxID=2562452 RepID=UPI00145608A4|nr:8-amino-7-oxononanoate synthase [Neolewinella litorea]